MSTGCNVASCVRPYPWGSELLAALKANTPPPLDINIQLLEQLAGGRGYSCQIILTRKAAAPAAGATAQQHGFFAGAGLQGAAAAGAVQTASDAAGPGGFGGSRSPCKLLVGCSSTDDLLLLRSLVPDKIDTQVQVTATAPFCSVTSLHHGVSQPLVGVCARWHGCWFLCTISITLESAPDGMVVGSSAPSALLQACATGSCQSQPQPCTVCSCNSGACCGLGTAL